MDVTFATKPFADLTPMELHDVLRLRGDVFVVEQRIWQENDLDGHDPDALFVMGRDANGDLVAAARVLLDRDPADVSRVVVRRDLRSRGVGAALMRAVGHVLGSRAASMSAQAHLEEWYADLGWHRDGPDYDEVGIPHVTLVRDSGAGS
jgi:ElaA protein